MYLFLYFSFIYVYIYCVQKKIFVAACADRGFWRIVWSHLIPLLPYSAVI